MQVLLFLYFGETISVAENTLKNIGFINCEILHHDCEIVVLKRPYHKPKPKA